jgi:hypothetical protein
MLLYGLPRQDMYSPNIESVAAFFHDLAQDSAGPGRAAGRALHGMSAGTDVRCPRYSKWYEADACAAFSQAMGRAYRGPRDHAVIVAVGVESYADRLAQDHVRSVASRAWGPLEWQQRVLGPAKAFMHSRGWLRQE